MCSASPAAAIITSMTEWEAWRNPSPRLLPSLMSTEKHLDITCLVYKRCLYTISPQKAQHHEVSQTQSLPSLMLTKNKTMFSISFYFHSIKHFFLFSAFNHRKLQLVLVTFNCKHNW